jgi:hypothetical protein
MASVDVNSDGPMAFVAMDAQFRTSIECRELGIMFVPYDLFASQDDANESGGTNGHDDGVQCSQYRQLASQTHNKDASQNQWEQFGLSQAELFNELQDDDYVLVGEDDLTLAGRRELQNTLNSGQRETEVPDGVSRWGEQDDDTEQEENGNTEKATKTAMRAFEQWRSDTKKDRSLSLAGMADFDLAKLVSLYATQQRKQDGGEYKVNNLKNNILCIMRFVNDERNKEYQASDGTEEVSRVNFLARTGPFNMVRKALDKHMIKNSKDPSLRSKGHDSFNDEENNKIVASGILTQKNAMSLNTRANAIFGYEGGFRGESEHSLLKWSAFELGEDVLYYQPGPSKGAQGGLDRPLTEKALERRTFYPRPDEPALCPLLCFKEMYALRTEAALKSSKPLPDRFYLQPKFKFDKDGVMEYVWAYNAVPMGKNAVAKFVPAMCEAAGITRRTNHSLRASATTDLKNSDVPDSVGMQVTRHKSVAAYNRYDRPSDKQQQALLVKKRRAEQLGRGEESLPPAQ